MPVCIIPMKPTESEKFSESQFYMAHKSGDCVTQSPTF